MLVSTGGVTGMVLTLTHRRKGTHDVNEIALPIKPT